MHVFSAWNKRDVFPDKYWDEMELAQLQDFVDYRD